MFLRVLSTFVRKERKRAFRPFSSIFDHFLHFLPESGNGASAVNLKP